MGGGPDVCGAMKKRRAGIRGHYESELLKWLTGDEKWWRRSGFRHFDRAEREGYCELFMVGYDANLIGETWRALGWPKRSHSLMRRRDLSMNERLELATRWGEP